MIAHVMAWRDTEANDFRALVDLIHADGSRTPGGAARGADEKTVGDWVMAIVLDIGPVASVKTTNCGEMARPSFEAVRTKALFVDTKDALDPGQQ